MGQQQPGRLAPEVGLDCCAGLSTEGSGWGSSRQVASPRRSVRTAVQGKLSTDGSVWGSSSQLASPRRSVRTAVQG